MKRDLNLCDGLTSGGIVLLLCPIFCFADEPQSPEVTESVTANNQWPELVDCVIGNLTIQIDGPKLWRLSGLEYRTQSIATRDSVFGDDSGILKRGQFLESTAKQGEGLERTARWMAVYDSVN
ncbi:MAG: hypothetical protein KDB01_04985 [Planctomycetaceae bacterium]|nr:hypothetical protein [Planctomycetaceae bacterium]